LFGSPVCQLKNVTGRPLKINILLLFFKAPYQDTEDFKFWLTCSYIYKDFVWCIWNVKKDFCVVIFENMFNPLWYDSGQICPEFFLCCSYKKCVILKIYAFFGKCISFHLSFGGFFKKSPFHIIFLTFCRPFSKLWAYLPHICYNHCKFHTSCSGALHEKSLM
jgi:hypothetical protein